MKKIIASLLLIASVANAQLPTTPIDGQVGRIDGVPMVYDSGSNSWVKIDSDSYENVLRYEAICDGTTDNTAKIQAAITASATSGKAVYFPSCSGANTYLINTGLTFNTRVIFAPSAILELPAGQTISFEKEVIGPTQTIFSGDGIYSFASNMETKRIYASWYGFIEGVSTAGTYLAKAINSVGGKELFVVEGTYDIRDLANVTLTEGVNIIGVDRPVFDGISTSQSKFVLQDGLDLHLENIEFLNMSVVVECLGGKTVGNFTFVNNEVSGGPYALRSECIISEARISDNHIHDITQTLAGGFAAGIFIGSEGADENALASDITITNNLIENIVNSAVDANPRARGMQIIAKRVVITGNTLKNIHHVNGGAGVTGSDGIYAKAVYTNISDNVLENAGNGEGGITIKGSGRVAVATPSYAHVVSGNTISYNDPTIITDQTAGIVVFVPDVLIEGNYVEGAKHSAIRAQIESVSRNLKISDNLITRDNSPVSIYAIARGSNVEISGNNIADSVVDGTVGSTHFAIQVQAFSNHTGVYIKDNNVSVDYSDLTGITLVQGIDIDPNSVASFTDIVISGNSFNLLNPGGTYYGLEFDFNTTTVERVYVSDNYWTGGISAASTFLEGNFFNNVDPSVGIYDYIIGNREQNIDYTLVFNGADNQCDLSFKEDEDQLSSECSIEHNAPEVYVSTSVQNLNASTQLAVNESYERVAGLLGPITSTATPSIAAGTAGQLLIIEGTNDTNTWTVQDNDTLPGSNVELAGNVSAVLGLGDTLELIYSATTSKWQERSRSDN